MISAIFFISKNIIAAQNLFFLLKLLLNTQNVKFIRSLDTIFDGNVINILLFIKR